MPIGLCVAGLIENIQLFYLLAHAYDALRGEDCVMISVIDFRLRNRARVTNRELCTDMKKTCTSVSLARTSVSL